MRAAVYNLATAVSLTVFCWLTACLPAPAATATDVERPYLVDVWQTDNGLPQNEVTSIAQTPEGYLWVGLFHGGLARFDGIRFTSYTPFDTPELKANEIQMVQVDSRGVLWIGPSDASLTTWSRGKFTLVRQPQRDARLRLQAVVCADSNRVVLASPGGELMTVASHSNSLAWFTCKPPVDKNPSFCPDEKGEVWFRTKKGQLGKLASTNLMVFQPDKEAAGYQRPNVTALCSGPDGKIWVGTDSGLGYCENGTILPWHATNDNTSFGIKAMTFSGDGGLWVLDQTGRLRKRLGDRWAVTAPEVATIANAATHSLLLRGDREGGVWIMNYGVGLWHISSQGTVYSLTREDGLPSLQISCLFEDREGNIWLGTTRSGLVCLKKRIFHVVGGDSLRDESVNSICEDAAGSVWLGTASGKVFCGKDGVWNPMDWAAFTGSASVDATVCSDTAGRLWIGSKGKGVWLWDNRELRRPFPPDKVANVPRILYADRRGLMWFGSEFGLTCWQDGVLKSFTPQELGSPCHVTGITEDNHGAIWISTADGKLLRYKDGKIKRFSGSSTYGLAHFWCLTCTPDGAVWIGTLGGGLVRFFDGKFVLITSKQGLPNNYISQLLHDNEGNLWAGSRGGIFRMSIRDLNSVVKGESATVPCELFGRADGLPGVECLAGFQPICWRGSDARLWFTTLRGAVWVNLRDLTSRAPPPKALIEDVWVNGYQPQKSAATNPGPSFDKVLESSGGRENSFHLSPGQHYIEFQFTALTLSSPEKVRFRWKMNGLDAGWNYGGTKRSASYSGLPPGHYQFQVTACAGDGIWHDTADSVQLTIAPYFSQTWTFKAMLLLAAAAMLYWLYALRISRLRALQRERLRIARDLHDEVGAGLGTIALLGEFIEDQPSASDGRAVRQMALSAIDALRDIVWFIDPSFEKFSDLTARMEAAAKASLPGLAVHFQRIGTHDSNRLPLAFRRNILPLFKEILHNIAKHARAKSVEIRVELTGNKFRLLVRDDGVGFNPDLPAEGNGIKNIRRRAKELGGNLAITSLPNEGTTINLTTTIP